MGEPKQSRRTHAARVAACVAALAADQAVDQQVETILDTHAEEAGMGRTILLALDDLVEFPWQARRHYHEAEIASLADHITLQGQLQPVRVRTLPGALVTKAAGGRAGARYQLVFGHRRLRAFAVLRSRAIAAGQPVPEIRAEVVDLDDAEARLQSIAENEKRGGLSAYERSLEVVSAIEVLRERLHGAEPTLRDLSPYFDGLTDQPLAYLRRIGEEFGDEREFRAAGLVTAAGDVDWAAIHCMTAEDLYEATRVPPADRARQLRLVARRREKQRDAERRAGEGGSANAPKSSRRGRRGDRPIATKHELLTTRCRFGKKLRGPFTAMMPGEARQHLAELLPALAALAEIANPDTPVVSLVLECGSAVVYLRAGMVGDEAASLLARLAATSV